MDRLTRETPRSEALRIGAACDRCGHCCQFSSGVMIDGEEEQIAAHLGISVEKLRDGYLEETTQFNRRLRRPKLLKGNKPYGRCIFYEGGCTIHEVKPLHCRVGTCGHDGPELTEWFYVNHVVDPDDEASLREWHIRTQGRCSLKGARLDEMGLPQSLVMRIKGELQ